MGMFALENGSFVVIKQQLTGHKSVNFYNFSFYFEIAKRMFEGFCCCFSKSCFLRERGRKRGRLVRVEVLGLKGTGLLFSLLVSTSLSWLELER